MLFELTMLYTYRALALMIAVIMIWVIFRQRDWQQQLFAALVFVPFALRAAGVK